VASRRLCRANLLCRGHLQRPSRLPPPSGRRQRCRVLFDNPSISEIGVQGTAFRVRLTDGRVLDQQDLVGAILEVSDDAGAPLTARIDGFVLDDRDPAREVVLYRVRALAENGSWQEFCHPDPDGERWAFPLAGSWTASGEHRNDVDVA